MWNLLRHRRIARGGAWGDYRAHLGVGGHCGELPAITEDVRFVQGLGWDWRDAAFEETARSGDR